MKKMQKTLFFGLAAKVLSDLVCNRPVLFYFHYKALFGSCQPAFSLETGKDSAHISYIRL